MTLKSYLFLSLYPNRIASTRLRFNPVQAALEARGDHVLRWSYFDDAEVDEWISGGLNRLSPMLAGAQRIRQAKEMIDAADCVIVQREALPFNSVLLERFALKQGKPLVWDVDDSLWVRRRSTLSHLRGSLWKYRWLARSAIQVWAGNTHLARRISQWRAREVLQVPTAAPTQEYLPPPKSRDRRLVWVGSPSTGRYLEAVLKAEPESFAGWPIDVVGAKFRIPDGINATFYEWSSENEDRVLRRGYAGLYPIDQTDAFSRGKSAYKAIQYMSYGLPVIATRTLSTVQVLHGSDSGLLIDSQWGSAIAEISDPTVHTRMALAGIQHAEANFCSTSWANQLLKSLSSIELT